MAYNVVLEPYSDIPRFTRSKVNSRFLRSALLAAGTPYQCEICKTDTWQGKFLSLHVDHIDGDRSNNLLANLRFLCPNCHSQTDTFGSKNMRKVKRPNICDETVSEAYANVKRAGAVPNTTAILKLLGRTGFTKQDREDVLDICSRHGLQLSRVPVVSPGAKRTTTIAVRSLSTQWPPDGEMAVLLKTNSLLAIGRGLGVSDNAVRKHCKSRGIALPKYRRSARRRELSRDDYLDKLRVAHGTSSGYRLERKLGRETCSACRAAYAASRRVENRNRKRAKAAEHNTTPR